MKTYSCILKRTFILGIIVILFIVSILPSSGKIVEKHSIKPISDANILYVGGTGPGNYTKIQLAINEAYEGDTVFVYDDSSPYNENLIVDKSINLIGENWETTIINGVDVRKATIQVINDWVNISGFTIKNGNGGIRIKSDNNTITRNNILENNWGGISLKTANFNSISGNKISNNFIGIQIYDKSCHNLISKNSILRSLRCNIVFGNPIFPLGHDPIYNDHDNSHYNLIIKNNIIGYGSAFFLDSWINTWDRNFWTRPRILPKIIRGFIGDYETTCWNIDWHPALLPYNIGL
ncbi:MAG: right-handed parallel beta-helix repeat-containing protein [Thermoplasmatales archaeon]|nr:MAG: right-handed parallel beta-helix repeat-containing protein [Thermoplasmatales archaeon]